MIEIPVLNLEGKEVGKVSVDEALLGSVVRPALLKQAIVRYHANKRQGTAVTRDRGEIEGSTKKLYAQKHTGNARRGNLRTNLMKGGGVAFGKRPRDFRQDMPATQRKLARNNAILAKIQSNNLKVLADMKIAAPKTKEVAKFLKALNAERSVLLALDAGDTNAFRAARNIAKTVVKPALEVSAYDVLSKRTMIITKSGLESVLKVAKPSKVKK
jgi:large subunit ribosomal protein L4